MKKLLAIQTVNRIISKVGAITVSCPNGDTLTAGYNLVLRWGKSEFASPNGKIVYIRNSIGETIVEQCGRGIVSEIIRKYNI